MPKRVLAVGNCGFDNSALRALFARQFQAETVTADSAAEALREAHASTYDLILVNRLLDADGSEGLAIIRQLKADATTQAMPVMLITNFADQQALAVAEGAAPGFGKRSLHEPETKALLAKYLAE